MAYPAIAIWARRHSSQNGTPSAAARFCASAIARRRHRRETAGHPEVERTPVRRRTPLLLLRKRDRLFLGYSAIGSRDLDYRPVRLPYAAGQSPRHFPDYLFVAPRRDGGAEQAAQGALGEEIAAELACPTQCERFISVELARIRDPAARSSHRGTTHHFQGARAFWFFLIMIAQAAAWRLLHRAVSLLYPLVSDPVVFAKGTLCAAFD